MFTAIDWASGLLVGAAQAHRGRFYRCPCCLGESFPRAGTSRTPHFAHKSSGVSIDCEDYHPSHGRLTSSFTGLLSRGATEYLFLDLKRSRWQMFVELDEIPFQESRGTAASLLLLNEIEMRRHGKAPQVFSLDQLWPGSARNLVTVEPSPHETRVNPTGQWPSSVDRARWQRVLPGIPSVGIVFVQYRGGSFRRYDPSMPVHWGHRIIVVGSKGSTPPQQMNPLPLEPVRTPEATWLAWVVDLPIMESPSAARWLTRFGIVAAPRQSRTQLLSPPISYTDDGAPLFLMNEPTVALPAAGAEFLVAESAGEVRGSNLPRTNRAMEQRLRAITARSPGPVRIRTDKVGDTTTYEVAADLDIRPTPLNTQWSVEFSDQTISPFTTITAISRPESVVVESTVPDLRFTVRTLTATAGTQTARDLKASAATRWLNEHSSSAQELEVDAGNLGFVRIRFSEPHPEVVRRRRAKPGWATAYELSVGRSGTEHRTHWLSSQTGRGAAGQYRRP
ncbi:hypothetical protein [Rhodococcus kronopolitis]|uniref:Competence protein CoiA-like N-terminal domain-containing protein n=1 Tax=Rhodococcus kronopolitis TaxID=1460226 RepID=A0ABV9FS72_9NOCA